MTTKPNRRKPIHSATKLNFRPPTSDTNAEYKGTKPTGEPTSVKEIFTIMVLFLCKKSLFYDTNLKVALYLAALFLISLIADVATIPRMYLSRSDNIFNKYFVKFAWGWNLMLLVPFVVFTSYIYCCGNKNKIVLHHLSRTAIATFFWYFWTSSFNYVEAAYGRCGIRNFGTKESCLLAGHVWNGFDLSGHSFILIYGSLVLIEETRCMMNWDSIKDYIRLEEHNRTTQSSQTSTNPLKNLTEAEFKALQFNYEKYTPYIRGIFILITILQLLWDVMLVCTILYYHVMIEKFLGGVIGIFTWFLTYRVWYTLPNVLPNLPGEGVFKYMKSKSSNAKESLPRRRASLINGSTTQPMFMGRPIYPQSQTDAGDDVGTGGR